MKWLLSFLGLTVHCSHGADDALARVRTASDEHTKEAADASVRVEEVIFNTRQSSLMTAIDIPLAEERQRVLEELLASKVRHAQFRR